MDAKSNMFINKIKLIENLSIRENVGIFDFLPVSRRATGNEIINKINKT
jgi:predicted glycosyltransferase involved in capsule biosynthesis